MKKVMRVQFYERERKQKGAKRKIWSTERANGIEAVSVDLVEEKWAKERDPCTEMKRGYGV